jgi:hypothetical protein
MPIGYPRVAAFLDSDDDFRLYRRFGYIQSRLLLEKQDDLRRLEEHLDRMDRKDSKKSNQLLMTRQTIGADSFKERRELMQEIETKYNEYCRCAFTCSIINRLNPRDSNTSQFCSDFDCAQQTHVVGV